MSGPQVVFTWQVAWASSGNGGYERVDDDGNPDARPYWQASEYLMDNDLVADLPEDIADLPPQPIWALVYRKLEPGQFWCFVEQGWGGPFGETGGCRFSFARFSHHPADVWRVAAAHAGQGRAVHRPAPDPAAVSGLLTALALNQERVQLPGTPAEHAGLIESVLRVLPAAVVSNWLWFTCRLGGGKPFVGGRPPVELRFTSAAEDEFWAGADLPGEAAREQLGHRWAALAGLAREAGRSGPVSAPVAEAARESRAQRLVDFLDTLAPDMEPADAVPPPVAAAPAAPAGRWPSDTSEVTVALSPRPAHRRSRSDLPAIARTRRRRTASPLIWVEWGQTSRGFDRLNDDGNPALAPFWRAGERLLDREKVPQRLIHTGTHPLWSLRRVELARDRSSWCFIERGKGVRVGADGVALPGRQFGNTGGCRFGFADFGEQARDVWWAGRQDAWTALGQPPAGDPGIIADLLTGIAGNQPRIRLPGDPAANVVLIDQLLAVLPHGVAAGWLWSTCMFRTADRFVGGSPPPDLPAEAAARPVQQAAAGTDVRLLPTILTRRQLPAFDRLLLEAGRAATHDKGNIYKVVSDVLRGSRATTLPAVLDELVDRIKDLRPMPIDQVPGELRRAGGPAVMHANHSDETQAWARTDPAEARRHLVGVPTSAAAPEVLAGLLEAQRRHPTANHFGVPTAVAPRPDGLATLTKLLRQHLEPGRGKELVEALTAPGALLSGFDNLTAAGPWLRELDYTPYAHPHLFPDHLVGQLANPATARDVLSHLLEVTDPVTVIVRAVDRMPRPSPGHASRVLHTVHVVSARRDLDPALLDDVTEKLVHGAGRGRARWLADVIEAEPPGAAPDDFHTRVLTAGGRELSRRAKGGTIYNTRLSMLSDRAGLRPDDTPFRPEPVRPDRSARPRLRLPGSSSRKAWGIIVAIVVLLAGATVSVAAGYRAGSQARPGASATPDETPDPPTPTGAPPTTSAPTSGPGVALPRPSSLRVQWQAVWDTPSAVQAITDEIKRHPGRPIRQVTLTGHAGTKPVATKAATEVRDGLLAAKLPELAGVPVVVRTDETDNPQIQGHVTVAIEFAA